MCRAVLAAPWAGRQEAGRGGKSGPAAQHRLGRGRGRHPVQAGIPSGGQVRKFLYYFRPNMVHASFRLELPSKYFKVGCCVIAWPHFGQASSCLLYVFMYEDLTSRLCSFVILAPSAPKLVRFSPAPATMWRLSKLSASLKRLRIICAR